MIDIDKELGEGILKTMPDNFNNSSPLNSPEFVKTFYYYVKNGNRPKSIMKLLGYNKGSYDRWVSKAKEDKAPYKEFITKVNRCLAVAEKRMVRVVMESAEDGDVNTAKWFLRVTNPDDWAEKQNVNIGQDKDFTVNIKGLDELSDDERDKLGLDR